jgi:hypothetical protein
MDLQVMECLKEEIEKAGEGSMRNQLEEDFHNGRIPLNAPPKNFIVVVVVVAVAVVFVLVCYCCESLGLLLDGVGGFVLTGGRVRGLCGDPGETEGVC